jgi:hypothetical protein
MFTEPFSSSGRLFFIKNLMPINGRPVVSFSAVA